MAELREGGPAPDFELPSSDGGTLRLSSLRGRGVVLFFYPRDFTSGCTAESCDFRDYRQRFDALGVTLLGVNVDPLSLHSKFIAKHQLNFTLLSDEKGAVVDAYDSWRVSPVLLGRRWVNVARTTVLIDRDGVIRKRWGSVNFRVHVAEVYEAARAIFGVPRDDTGKAAP